jgi:hypothetical protein
MDADIIPVGPRSHDMTFSTFSIHTDILVSDWILTGLCFGRCLSDPTSGGNN